MVTIRPAWSFDPHAGEMALVDPLDLLADTRDWLEKTGRGVKVAVVDSGIDNDHPAIEGAVTSWGEPYDSSGRLLFRTEPHSDSGGHGTACAGIIRQFAPDVELMSVRVLGPDLSGTGMLFAAGLHWAIDNGAQVVNLSLGTTKRDFYAILHELADLAYFKRVVLVAAANNLATSSFPSVYSSVISVASQEDSDPLRYCYNPSPPVEFSAPGIDVRVPWSGGTWVRSTGNSYAAPHITALVARMLERWPQLTPFQVKTLLRSHAWNVRNRQPAVDASS